MFSTRRRSILAVTGCAAALGSLLAPASAHAATDPVNNDYGQSPAQVTSEVAAQVAALPAVVTAKARVVAADAARLRAAKLEAAAKKSHKGLPAAHLKATKAKTAETKAKVALAKATAVATMTVRSAHYTPVDGTYLGPVSQYFIPSLGLEPIQVSITVYGGHVSDLSVPVYVSTGTSGEYNAMALPQLTTRAMAAHDTATVASVSGASLTSEAFVKSLTAALAAAGFKE